jgi:hypothetical protein
MDCNHRSTTRKSRTPFEERTQYVFYTLREHVTKYVHDSPAIGDCQTYTSVVEHGTYVSKERAKKERLALMEKWQREGLVLERDGTLSSGSRDVAVHLEELLVAKEDVHVMRDGNFYVHDEEERKERRIIFGS